jgi:hypothetical protein
MSAYDIAPCYYKKTCGFEYCNLDECPYYRAKKKGEKYYTGEEDDG